MQPRQIRHAGRNIRPRSQRQRLDVEQQISGHLVPAPMPDDRSVFVDQPAIGRRSAGSLWVNYDRFRESLAFIDARGQSVVITDVVPRPDRIDEHLHSPAADESVIPAVIVVQMERDNFRLPLVQEKQRPPFDLGFDAAAAQSPCLGAIGKDEHRRARFLRRRSSRLDQGRKRNRLLVADRCGQVVQDIAHRALSHCRDFAVSYSPVLFYGRRHAGAGCRTAFGRRGLLRLLFLLDLLAAIGRRFGLRRRSGGAHRFSRRSGTACLIAAANAQHGDDGHRRNADIRNKLAQTPHRPSLSTSRDNGKPQTADSI